MPIINKYDQPGKKKKIEINKKNTIDIIHLRRDLDFCIIRLWSIDRIQKVGINSGQIVPITKLAFGASQK